MGKTELKTAYKPTFSRFSISTPIWRKSTPDWRKSRSDLGEIDIEVYIGQEEIDIHNMATISSLFSMV